MYQVSGIIESMLHHAMGRYINAHGGNAARVTSFDTDTYDYGGCSTCGPGITTVVEIDYVEAGTGRRRLFTYRGGLAELIRALDQLTEEG